MTYLPESRILLLASHVFFLSLFASAKVQAEEHLQRYISKDVTEKQASTKIKPPIIAVESPYDFDTTVQNLKKAITGRNFRLIRVQQLTEGFTEQEPEIKDTLIYFCNFNLVNKAIKIDARIGQFLPCRITVHQGKGKVIIMVMNPEPLAKLLGHKKLKKICSQITDMYRSLLEDATM